MNRFKVTGLSLMFLGGIAALTRGGPHRMRSTVITALSVVTLLSACATGPDMRSGGRLIGTNGLVMPLTYEFTYDGKGAMTAVNPVTGETFTGRYTALRQTGTQSNLCPTKAYLVGSAGTTLTIDLMVEPGDPPKGIGEAVDNKGNHYQVMF